jgi:hypothetical protein
MSELYIHPHRRVPGSITIRAPRSLSDLVVVDEHEGHVVTAIGTDKVYVIRYGYRCWLRGKGACHRHTKHRMGELVDGVQWMRVITDHELWAYPKGYYLR